MKENPKNSPKMNQFYTVEQTPELQKLLQKADELKAEIDQQKPLSVGVWETVQEKLRVDWTYNSNAIEGSTLTRGETLFFLQEGLTVEGKPLQDFMDAKNHHEAIEFLYEVIKNERPVSEGLIKEINALLLKGVTHTLAKDQFGNKTNKVATPGQYKKLPNHVQLADGALHRYVEPEQVGPQMRELVDWLNKNSGSLHPAVVGAIAHYNLVRIHPFDDGNGRGARILMNLILIKNGFPPAVIKNEQRRLYLDTLAQADEDSLTPFINFTTESLVATQQIMVSDLKLNPDKK